MGLDGVEMVMAWEEVFGITIGNDETATLITPRMAIDLIARKLGASDDTPRRCLTLRAFNRVRAAISAGAGVHRNAIRPDVRVRELVPREDRLSTWRRVQCAFGKPFLPNLDRFFGHWSASFTVGDLARGILIAPAAPPQAAARAMDPFRSPVDCSLSHFRTDRNPRVY